VGIDVGVLSLAMLIVLLLSSWKIGASLQWLERAAAYISVVLLVYLDQTTHDKAPLMMTVSWLLIGITGAAALLRFWLSPTRRFEVTTLDLLVLFIALVLPNLPGSVVLPADLPTGIAKAVILLYVVEMLQTINIKHPMPRVILMVTLAVIAGRALLGTAV
jgi:UDP-GlcNAc:undecaprenyl-phosphate/decaprenyl-phosphate GlcNAc-1-phosphate transferase